MAVPVPNSFSKQEEDKVRILEDFSYGSSLNFVWRDTKDVTTDKYRMTGTEPPAPELAEKLQKLTLLLQSVFNFSDGLMLTSKRSYIKKVCFKYIESKKGEKIRYVCIKADMLTPKAEGMANLVTPYVSDGFTSDILRKGELAEILDDLQKECFNYIDGFRAQGRLNFDEAEKQAEEKEDAEE